MISITEAISVFYHKVKQWIGLPFEIRIRNKMTIQTFNDTYAGKNLVHCEDSEDMFNKLGI